MFIFNHLYITSKNASHLKTTLRFYLTFLFLLSCSSLLNAQGPGNALKFDGMNDHVVCGNSNRGITNTITVEAWVKTTSFKYHWVVGKYDRYGGERGYHLIIKDGKAAFAGRDGSGQYRNSGYTPDLVNDGNWHHLAGVSHEGTWKIYVDGILRSEFRSGYKATDLTNSAPLALGKDFMADSENFNGLMDEVRIWKTALTTEEIRQRMCSKIANYGTNVNLVAYYNFDNAGTSTVKDLSSLKLDGAFRNMNPSTAWVTSSAPIGDQSYQNYDVSSISYTSKGGGLGIQNLSTGIQGTHIYYVKGKPNNTSGIDKPEQVEAYLGIFKVGSPQADYRVDFIPELQGCNYRLYRRPDNAAGSWSLVTKVPTAEQLSYTGTSNQGEFTATTTVIEPPKIAGSGAFCKGGSSVLSISTTGDVLWSTGAKSKSITVSQPGDYTVTVSLDGCTFTDQVTVQEIAFPEVELGQDRTLCGGEQAMLEAPAGNYTYKWNTGATTRAIEAKTSGKYWVEVTNTNGCTTRDEVTVEVKPQPNFTLPQEFSACYGERITVDATTPGATYLWSTGQTTATVHVTAPANLSVAITVNGCTYIREVTVNSDECPVIPNIITPNGDGKNDTFVLQGINIDQVEIEIFNRWGASVYKRNSYDNKWAGAGSGMYYYHIKSRQSQKVYKGWIEVVL